MKNSRLWRLIPAPGPQDPRDPALTGPTHSSKTPLPGPRQTRPHTVPLLPPSQGQWPQAHRHTLEVYARFIIKKYRIQS